MFISASAATTINLDVWNKMPKDIQDIIAEEALIAEEEIQRLTAEDLLRLSRTDGRKHDGLQPARGRTGNMAERAASRLLTQMLAKMGDFANEVKETADEANAKYPYPF